MIYQSDKIAYSPVMTAIKGKVNDVLICRDAGMNRDSYYTLLVLKNHETVKKLICIMENSIWGYESCVDFFQWQNQYCLVFPQVKERRLQDFYMAEQFKLGTCTKICENLVLQCMMSKLPYPLLYLVLVQNQIHLLKDSDIELGYTLDLEMLDETVTEKECAAFCGTLIRELLQPKRSRKNISYQLLNRKLPRESYQTFSELYRDLKTATKAGKRQNILQWLKSCWNDSQGSIFRILLVLCVILILFTLGCLISKAIWGDIPFLRVLFNHFKVIGTESMVS